MVRRRGISVIEVLFAIGVAAVGLLGVIVLLPVALHSVGRGTIADRASRVSSNALSEIHARSILETSKWWWRNRGVSPTVVQYVNASSNSDDLYRAFAIDPRFVAHNGLVDYNGATYVGANLFPYVFPYSVPGPGSPRMERISLDTGLGAMMSAAFADQIFVSRDDLVFDIPAEKTLPPSPQFGDGVRDKTTSRLGTQRQYQGDMSWMATVVPKYDESDAFNDEYILSIVIFQKRDPTFTINEINERVATVTAFPGGGLNGGGVTIQSTVSADYLDLRAGNWVLLMSRPAPFSSAGIMGQHFRWYRVTDTEVEPRVYSTSPNVWERDVTLDGPDWRPDIATEMAIISNVVHILERTVRLGSTSLWMP
jgi:hypothetical protein